MVVIYFDECTSLLEIAHSPKLPNSIDCISTWTCKELTASICTGSLICRAGKVVFTPPSHRVERSVIPFCRHPIASPVFSTIVQDINQAWLIFISAALHDV